MRTWLLLLFGAAVLPAASPVLTPVTVRQDFQDRNLGQWSSYPPVQDAGYDPSITPTADYSAPGGRALMRVVRPPSPGTLKAGFIRRLDLVSGAAVRISFSYRLKPGRPACAIEAGLAGADGRSYTATVKVEGEGWSRAVLAFPMLTAGIGLQAVYIMAVVPDADPDFEYRFLIDDVTIEAAQSARFELRKPPATAIFPWPAMVAAASYARGDTISVEAAAPMRLTSAECRIKDQDGRTVASRALVLKGGAWVNDALHTVRPSDPTGVWRLELRGLTDSGRQLTTDVRVLVRPGGDRPHPRLYFDGAGLAALAARTRDPQTASIWTSILKAAESRRAGDISLGARLFALLDPVHLLPTLQAYFQTAGTAENRLTYNALVAAVAGDQQARAAAKSALLAVAGWQTWIPPWFEAHGQHTYYPAGELSSAAAFAYDVLQPDLSAAERAQVRRALLDRGILPVYREYVLDNRITAGTSNWIGHTVGGAITAVAAIDDGGNAPELTTCLGGLLLKLEDHLAASYLADGSYGEGVSYQEFDLKSTAPALEALHRVYGIDYWSRSHVAGSLYFPLYLLAQPARETGDMGDSHPPSTYSSAPAVRRSGDPVLRWYYDRFPHRSFADFVFFPDNVKPSGPPAEPSRSFAEKGAVVFRSGWGPEDAILHFRAGPNYNHNHADQGSFLLRAHGENLAVEAGPAHYYDDPYYATYFTQAAGHNTILVDGNPASQELGDTSQFRALARHARLIDVVTSDFHDALGSELAAVYGGRLQRFTRRVVFRKPDYIVISDELAANGAPASFGWRMHVNDLGRLETTTGGAVYRGQRAALSVKVLQPSGARVEAGAGRLRHSVFSSRPAALPAQPGLLSVSAGPAQNARFLVVLAPESTPEKAAASAARVEAVAAEGCAGVRAGDALILFRDAGAPECRHGQWSTDAAALTAAADMLSAELATRVRRGGTTVLESDRPISVAVQFGSAGAKVVTTAAAPAALALRVGERTVRLQVPAGRSRTAAAP